MLCPSVDVPQCDVPYCDVPQCGVSQCDVPQYDVPQCDVLSLHAATDTKLPVAVHSLITTLAPSFELLQAASHVTAIHASCKGGGNTCRQCPSYTEAQSASAD